MGCRLLTRTEGAPQDSDAGVGRPGQTWSASRAERTIGAHDLHDSLQTKILNSCPDESAHFRSTDRA